VLGRVTRRRAPARAAATGLVAVSLYVGPRASRTSPAGHRNPEAGDAKPGCRASRAADAKPTTAAQPVAQPTVAAQAAPGLGSGSDHDHPAEVGLGAISTPPYQDSKQNLNYKVNVSRIVQRLPAQAGLDHGRHDPGPDPLRNSTILHEYGGRGANRDLNPYLQKDNIQTQAFQPLLYLLSTKTTPSSGRSRRTAAPLASTTTRTRSTAGVPYPKKDTFADFRETARKLTIDKSGMSGTAGFDPSGIAVGCSAGRHPATNNWQG
jgi:hypothetical protein